MERQRMNIEKVIGEMKKAVYGKDDVLEMIKEPS